MRKSLGDKRRAIPREKAEEILRLLQEFKEGEFVRIYPTTHIVALSSRSERAERMAFITGTGSLNPALGNMSRQGWQARTGPRAARLRKCGAFRKH
jgi:hypothetical protein